MEISIIQGDIAEQSADAIVNAAGTSLRMGSGVAGALRRKGGDEINRDALAKGPVELGAVAVTDAYELDARYVIHAAAMPHDGDGKATAESIRHATMNALSAADDLECRTLVIPALGCGVAGFDLEEGAQIIAETLVEYDAITLESVSMIAYSADEHAIMHDAARAVMNARTCGGN